MPGVRKWYDRRIIGLLLANLSLLALFVWGLGESTPLRVEVRDGVCTAILGGRTNAVACPGIEGGQVGLYNVVHDDEQPSIVNNPWRLLIPDSSWRALTVAEPGGPGGAQLLQAGRPLGRVAQRGQWRTAAGELQPMSDQASMRWANPLSGGFILQGLLRRPSDGAGLLLLRPDGDDGWLFLYDSRARLGTWWRWQAGQPVQPLLGAPLQKSLTAQIQSLLRLVLLGHQAALVLLLACWLLGRALARISRRFRQTSGPAATALPGAPGQPAGRANTIQRLLIIALFLWIFACSLFIASDLLDGIPHVQDSITYRFQAQTLARGHLTAPAPPEPDAFEQEFLLVKDGRWFGKYPPGYPLLLAAGELMGLPWLVNPLLATLTAALLFDLARIWYGRRVGLLALLLVAVSPFFLIMSGTFMAHPAELFWVVAFMSVWTRIMRQARSRSRTGWLWLIAAGSALGMIFLTRQLTALALAGPFALAATLAYRRRVPWSRRVKDLLFLGAAAAPFALSLCLYQAAVTGDPFQDPRLLYWSFDHLGFGQDIGQGQNVVTFDTIQGEPLLVWQHDSSQPPRGHTPARGVFNLERNWSQLQSYLFGWLPAFTMAFAWLLFVSGRARRIDWILLIAALVLVAAYIFYWADGIIYGPRYYYAALPAFLLLVARGIQSAAALTDRRVVALVVAAFAAGGLLVFFPPVLEDLRQYNFIDAARVDAVETAVDERALVIVSDEHGDWWVYGSYFTANTPWLDGRIIYARDLGQAANDLLRSHFPDREAYFLHGDLLQRMPPLTQ